MSRPSLAIYGGPPAVKLRYRERWRQVRVRDLLWIAAYGLLDRNTEATGSGPVRRFERRFADLCGTRFALAMNSGTAALHSAYFAVGVGPGSEVIVPAYTWYASATPLLQLGARPVFCDVDGRTLLADPDDAERRITPATRAICVVHVWGNPAPMDRFAEIARRHGVALIEDASHAHGARYLDRSVGSYGDVGCFSLQGRKPVSGGEAGIAVTDDPDLFDRMLALGHPVRTAAGPARERLALDGLSLGLKYRPHLYAILLAGGSLSRLGELNRRRRHHYALLARELEGCKAVQPIGTTHGGERGGLCEFLLRYDPLHAGGWSCGAFVAAARAEGVPVDVDRYTRLGRDWSLLPDAPLFREGEQFSADERADPKSDWPATRRLPGRLLTLPPFTRVSDRFTRQCAAALRKVADAACAIDDLRG